MDEDIKKALDGELDDQGLKDLESKLSDEGKRILKEALAFKAKKRDEEEKAKKASEIADAEEKRVADLKAEADRIENELSHSKEQMSQFRQEQILKAKNKFFSDYNIPAEQQEEYSKKFERFDSGKVDPDLIYDDFVSVYAALNKDALLKSQKDIEEMKKNAELLVLIPLLQLVNSQKSFLTKRWPCLRRPVSPPKLLNVSLKMGCTAFSRQLA